MDGVRNDAIEELQIIVHENTLTHQFEIVSAIKKPLEGSATELANTGGDTCQGRFEYITAMLRRKMDKFRGAGVVDCYGGEDHHRTGYYRSRHGEHGGDQISGNYHGENHMKDSQQMKGNRYMGETQGRRSHCGYHGELHISQWLKHPRPNHHRGNPLTRLVRQILIPILVGILAGVGATLAGLIVGKCMQKLYQVVATRGCGGTKSEEHEDGSDEEKGLLKDMEALEVAVEGLAYLEEGTKTAEKE